MILNKIYIPYKIDTHAKIVFKTIKIFSKILFQVLLKKNWIIFQ